MPCSTNDHKYFQTYTFVSLHIFKSECYQTHIFIGANIYTHMYPNICPQGPNIYTHKAQTSGCSSELWWNLLCLLKAESAIESKWTFVKGTHKGLFAWGDRKVKGSWMNKLNSLCKTNEPEDETDLTSNIDETEKLSKYFTYLVYSITSSRWGTSFHSSTVILSHPGLSVSTLWQLSQ